MGSKKKATPEACRTRLTQKARQDIIDITDYISLVKNQPINALKVGEALSDMIDRIGVNPYVFKECEEIPTIGRIYRKAACLSWYIIYKITVTEIVILGVIHHLQRHSKIKLLRNAN